MLNSRKPQLWSLYIPLAVLHRYGQLSWSDLFMCNIHHHNQLTHIVNKVTAKNILCIPVSSLAMLATSLNYFPSAIRPPCVDPRSTSASSNDYSYFVWIAVAFAGGLALLAVGICTIAAIILIRKRLKQRRRHWVFQQSPHPNVTSQQGQPAGSTSGTDCMPSVFHSGGSTSIFWRGGGGGGG